MKIAVIIPALNEAAVIASTLAPLQSWRQRGHQLILVDGGSADETVAIATPLVDRVITTGRGRAHQMNAGASVCQADILCFVHADTILSSTDDQAIVRACEESDWGRFNVRFTSNRWYFRLIATMMNYRSCLSSIATGDQAIFVRTDTFRNVGGYPQQPLMEDIELSKRLKIHSRGKCLRGPVTTSSRRWEHYGVVRTVILMWLLRLAYFLGIEASTLKRFYR